MQPAPEAPRSNRGMLMLSITLLALAVGVIGFALFSGRPAEQAKSSDAQTTATSPTQTAAVSQETTAPVQQGAQSQPVSTKVDEPVAANPQPAATSTPAEPQPAAAVASQITNTPAAETTVQAAASQTNAPASASTNAATAAVSTSVPTTFPDLKLHAIYYRLRGPTVVINGKTLKKGESIEGVNVVAINRNSVEVEWNGTKRYLVLQ